MMTLVYSTIDPLNLEDAIKELTALRDLGHRSAVFELDYDLDLVKIYPRDITGESND